jgi:hypothetical protein
MDATFDFLFKHLPIIAIMLIVSIASVSVSWIWFKVYHRFKKVEDEVKKIPCNLHERSIQTIQNDVSIMSDIKFSIRKIEEYIIKQDPASLDSLVRKCSPYKITSFGEVLLENSGAKKCVDDNVNFFILEIQKLEPKVALDVEQNALSVLNENLKHDFFNDIKNYIYNLPNPTEILDKANNSTKLNIKMESVLMVMSIYLRDKYFELHPEIDVANFFPQNKLSV